MTTNTDLHGAMPELPDMPHPKALLDTGGGWMAITNAFTADQMREYARAAIQQAAGAVPEGFQIVPIEPTPDMLFEGARSIIDGQEDRHGSSWADEAELAYKAMLTASPAPPKQQPDHLAGGECGGVQVPLTDEYVAKVVRSVQPHLSVDSKAWRDQMGECHYWLDVASRIAPRPSAPTGQINPDKWCNRHGVRFDGYPSCQKCAEESQTRQINPDSAGQGMEGWE